MKITLALPEGKDFSARLRKEINLASNIKDKATRESIITGLKKIEPILVSSKAYLWDGKDLDVFDYPLHLFVYHCGSEFKAPEGFVLDDLNNKYLLVTLDANEVTIGKLNGKRIDVLWNEESFVPRKHNKGGQSKVRFQRNRELALKKWLGKVADKINEFAKI